MILALTWLYAASSILTLVGSACLKHPADLKDLCLERQVPCKIPQCLWCQEDQCMECEPGYYLDLEKAACLPCAQGCNLCFGPNSSDCFNLKPGFTVDQNAQIIPVPLEGCLTLAYEDNDPAKEICTMCKPGYQYTKGSSVFADNLDCKKCEVENCQGCQESLDTCDICENSYEAFGKQKCNKRPGNCQVYSTEFGRCLDCPEGQKWSYQSNDCVTCPSECLTCSKSGKCLGCISGYFHKPESMLCVPCSIPGCQNCADGPEYCVSCTYGKYFDLLKQKCMNCDKSCATCVGPKPEDCTRCRLGTKIQEINFSNIDSDIVKYTLEGFRAKFPLIMYQHTYMALNFHPDKERVCVENCRGEEFYKDKLEATSIGSSRTECPSIDVLHHLMSTKHSTYFQASKATDEEDAKLREEGKQRLKKKTTKAQEDLKKRDAEDEEGDQNWDESRLAREMMASVDNDI